MDIVERLAQQAAETINGGEFNDGKWYTEGQRQAWRKAMTPAADEIEQLREKSKADEELKAKAAEMIEQLRLRNDRLRATLKMVTSKSHSTIYEI